MTQYSNPDLTQREIVEQSLAAIVAMLAKVDETVAAADAHRENVLDYQTAQIIGQHTSSLNGGKLQLEAERVRLANIIAVWDGEEPEPVGTPSLPYVMPPVPAG